MFSKIKICVICLFFILFGSTSCFPQDSIYPDSLISLALPDPEITLNEIKKGPDEVMNRPYSLWHHQPNMKRIGHNSLIMIGGCIMSSGILYMLPESTSNWDRSSMSFRTIFKDWRKNVSKGPVVDHDDFFLNYVTHPYCGALYYMGARGAGANMPHAFLYSFLLSTFFWEYGIEAFAEVPSVQDLIVTPVCGAILGEAFFLAKRQIAHNDYRIFNSPVIGHTAIFLMDPLNELLDLCSGTYKKNKRNNNVSLSSNPMLNPNGQISYNVSLQINF